MKKLFLLTSLCIPLFSYALTKNDLENSIRSLDVVGVKQIIEHEKFTSREYSRYLDLAEEVVRSRELWILKKNCYYEDITTPSTLSGKKIALQLLASGALFSGITILSDPIQFPFISKRNLYINIMACSGAALLFKCLLDYLFDIAQQIKSFRKKYEDAVTIKQLIYAADIVEA